MSETPIGSRTLSIILGYDPTTLRERVDLRAAGERLEELGSLRSLSALNEKAVLLRLLGRLDEAIDIANEAVRQARFTGDREQLLGARIRHAQVLQYQGKADEAIIELTGCVDEARGREWTALEAFAIQNRGKVWFDTGDYENALADMTAAVFLREKLGASPAEIQAALTAVAVVQSALDVQRGSAGGAGSPDGQGGTDHA
ncbi:tetratricopeptide repeat protein [Leifsonia shinshuensis]|uniref:tetratricopeptide repeat protein n=1 Tax=Leifsonia shinshuensis TaxID=150026 RepID=UPI00285BCA14|nr:tetratricopeptide repeat protein [Leifsonia shinshuensis]MDR6971527.1 tetratricopeptide (TPR) repeat protein [Leifsonia shinshuensis]